MRFFQSLKLLQEGSRTPGFKTRAALARAVMSAAVVVAGMSCPTRLWAQGTTLFPTPSGRYYDPYRAGPYGSESQGVGGVYSAGSPNLFTQGATLPPTNAYNPSQWPNVYTNQPYGGRFYFRPMVGPAYDPFRNGR